jgi:predicted signal transduction protein with EAL and GGDEF domain
MNPNLTELSSNAEFQFQLRQAVLAARQNLKHAGLLLIAFERARDPLAELGYLSAEFSEEMVMRLRNTLRDSDTVLPMDSGQIAVLLTPVGGPDDVDRVAEKILARLQEPFEIEDLTIHPELLIGGALFPEHSDGEHTLMQRADDALTTAKRRKQCYTLYSQDDTAVESPRLWTSELRQAITTEQLFLEYQPKVNLKQGCISGVEVLTRWQHPELGVIVPDVFIPVAERTGLIVPLTLWVLHRSLLQCRKWNQMGLNLSVAVNLSMWNLEVPELPDQISSLLKSTDLSPDKLELEITESAIMRDPSRVMRTLTSIRDLGVRIGIDDFGIGYSSLAHLRKLPVECIKIDKSFVQNIEEDRDNIVIVRSIIDLGHNLGLKVIAEGVETLKSKDILQSLKCDEAQGFYYSRPITADKMTPFLIVPPSTVRESAVINGTFRRTRSRSANRRVNKSTGNKTGIHNERNSTLDLKPNSEQNRD